MELTELLGDPTFKGKEFFRNNKFKKCIEFYKPLLGSNVLLDQEDIDIYLFSILRLNDVKEIIDTNHSKYIHFRDLRKLNDNHHDIFKLKCYQNYSKFGFGKYQGRTLIDVVKENPSYILWCIIKLYHFAIPNFYFADSILETDTLYLKSLEINLIKNLLITDLNNEQIESDNMFEEIPLPDGLNDLWWEVK